MAENGGPVRATYLTRLAGGVGALLVALWLVLASIDAGSSRDVLVSLDVPPAEPSVGQDEIPPSLDGRVPEASAIIGFDPVERVVSELTVGGTHIQLFTEYQLSDKAELDGWEVPAGCFPAGTVSALVSTVDVQERVRAVYYGEATTEGVVARVGSANHGHGLWVAVGRTDAANLSVSFEGGPHVAAEVAEGLFVAVDPATAEAPLTSSSLSAVATSGSERFVLLDSGASNGGAPEGNCQPPPNR